MKKFIVKVQLPLFPPNSKEAMVYNEDRSIQWMGEVGEDVRKIMGREPKKFFYAVINKDKTVGIEEEAPWQDW